MLDISNISNSKNNVQVFTNPGTWVTWVKPRNAKFVNIFCMGSGAGGNSGATTTASRLGGSGGGGGGVVRAVFNASILPDVLYVYTGAGGAGGIGSSVAETATVQGGNGERSFVTITPDTSSITNIVVTSGSGSARVGAVAAGSTGAGEVVATAANARFLNLGVFVAQAGTAGAGSSTTNGGAPGARVTITLGGGGGGGSTATVANGLSATGPFPAVPNTTAGGGVNGNGKDGIMITSPILGFISGIGGTGANNTTNVNGGNGGNGSYGCGGGGGGGGTSGSGKAGNGGRGGDGMVIITTIF
jgi:hypothetical protein